MNQEGSLSFLGLAPPSPPKVALEPKKKATSCSNYVKAWTAKRLGDVVMRDLSEMTELPPHKDLENLYRKLFSSKFKTYCVITDDDSAVFIWLAMEFGKARASHIIETYFKSTDKFLIDKGFAPKFIKTNISGLLAKVGDTGSKEKKEKRHLVMRLNCDKCFKDFTWTGYLKDLESPSNKRLCEGCK